MSFQSLQRSNEQKRDNLSFNKNFSNNKNNYKFNNDSNKTFNSKNTHFNFSDIPIKPNEPTDMSIKQITKKEIAIPVLIDVQEAHYTNDIKSIVALLGDGRKLDHQQINYMKKRQKFNFENIRIHDDLGSKETANIMQSEAFTIGNHIVLGEKYRSSSDDWILFHEIAHTIQQTEAIGNSSNTNPEKEANDFADFMFYDNNLISPEINHTQKGLARKVIWKFTQNLPKNLLLVLDVDDGDFVGGCVKQIAPHIGAKLIKKGVPRNESNQLFNIHLGVITNDRGQYCIFFYESVTKICEMKCFPTLEELLEALKTILVWLVELITKVLIVLGIAALIVVAVFLAAEIAAAIVAAIPVLILALG